MSKNVKRNVEGLRHYAESLKKKTEEHVNATIDELIRKKSKINFRTVSAASGISTTTLYNNPELRTRISSLRAVKKADFKGETNERTAQDREKELRCQIRQLKEEKEMLIKQLVDMERLMEENQNLKKLLSQKKIE